MKHRFGLFTLAVLLIAAVLPIVNRGALAAPSPRPPESRAAQGGALTDMLGLLPALPLGGDASPLLTFADITVQMEALGLPASPTPDEEAEIRKQALMSMMTLPQQAARMGLPEWREAFGFDLSEIDRTLDYSAPPFAVGILVGRFDETALTQAWEKSGYKPVTAGETTYYSIRGDNQIDIQSPAGRLTLATYNNVGLLDEHTLVYSSTHEGIEDVIKTRAGQGSTMRDDISIAPMLPSLPADLTSALIVHGSALVAMQDPLVAINDMRTPGVDIGAIATKTAKQVAEAKKMPPIAAALIGETAGGPTSTHPTGATPTPGERSIPAATSIIALTTISHDAATAAVSVIEERLATQRPPSGGPDGATFAALYPERSVTAVADQPVVLVELHPATGVPRGSLVRFFFQRALTFVAWSL